MHSSDVGGTFCEIVRSYDVDNLCDFIIWNGKQATSDFLSDPKSAIPLAETMSQNPEFDYIWHNSLRRLIYC